jgi:general secretion pathway protein G
MSALNGRSEAEVEPNRPNWADVGKPLGARCSIKVKMHVLSAGKRDHQYRQRKVLAVFNTLKTVQRNREASGEPGFTLIELLIVIVVLGILAAIVVFALGGVTSSSAAAACATDAQSVNVAIAAEQTQQPGVPPVLQSGSAAGDLVPEYLATLPNSSYYSISVSAAAPWNTLVTLTQSNDPGVVAVPGLLNDNGDIFNGNTAYQYSGTGTSLDGQGICAGA